MPLKGDARHDRAGITFVLLAVLVFDVVTVAGQISHGIGDRHLGRALQADQRGLIRTKGCSRQHLRNGAGKRLGRGKLHFSCGHAHRYLHAATTGHAFAGGGIAGEVIDLQAVLPPHQIGADNDVLTELGATHIAQSQVNHQQT
jgi:hypothetical protein